MTTSSLPSVATARPSLAHTTSLIDMLATSSDQAQFVPPLRYHFLGAFGTSSLNSSKFTRKSLHSVVCLSPRTESGLFGSIVDNADKIKELARTKVAEGSSTPIDTGTVVIDVKNEDIELSYGSNRKQKLTVGVHPPRRTHRGVIMRLYPKSGDGVHVLSGIEAYQIHQQLRGKKQASADEVVKYLSSDQGASSAHAKETSDGFGVPRSVRSASFSSPASVPSAELKEKKIGSAVPLDAPRKMPSKAPPFRTVRSSSFSGRTSAVATMQQKQKAPVAASTPRPSASSRATTKQETTKRSTSSSSALSLSIRSGTIPRDFKIPVVNAVGTSIRAQTQPLTNTPKVEKSVTVKQKPTKAWKMWETLWSKFCCKKRKK